MVDNGQTERREEINWGQLSFRPAPALQLDNLPVLIRDIMRTELCFWTPQPRFGSEFGLEAGLALLIVTSSSGMRWLLPHTADLRRPGPFSPFYIQAWHCGFDVLRLEHAAQFEDRNSRSTYRFMWFFFQRSRKFREYLNRAFSSASELVIKKGTRDSKSTKDILPWLGNPNTAAAGLPQSVDELIGLGQYLAKTWGVRGISRARSIRFGLTAVTKKLSVDDVQTRDTRQIARAVFFDLPPPPAGYSDDVQHDVEQCVMDTVEPWVMDDSMPRTVFDELFWGRSNTLLKKVASQRSPPIDSEIVRYAVLDLCWQAFAYMAQCIEAIMRDVRRALPEPLSAREERAFKLLYSPQPFFADLPLIFLDEKLPFVSPLLDELVESPNDPAPVRAFDKLLQLYVAMVDARKAADREAKPPKSLTTVEVDTSAIPQPPRVLSPEDEVTIADILDRVRVEVGVTCDCPQPRWTSQIEDFKCNEAVLAFTPQCHAGGPAKRLVSIKVIRRAAGL